MGEKPKKPYQFLNSFYFKQRTNDGERQPDRLAIIYRNEATGEKQFKVFEQPKFSFFVAKEDIDINHHMTHIPLDQVDKYSCKYNELLMHLAELQDAKDTYFQYIRERAFGMLNTFHKCPWIFGSDINIEDYYKGMWLDTYHAPKNVLTKSYTDIEVDSIDIIGFPEPDEALCPVNALTHIDEESKTSWTLLLRNPKNPLIAKFEKNIKAFKKSIKDDPDVFDQDLTYKFKFFDNELDLLVAYFDIVNEDKPDFDLIWNSPFDLKTILNRAKKLGMDARELACHPDFDPQMHIAVFHDDTRNQKASDKGHWFECTSYTQWLDQLVLYASLRKGMGEKESYSLGAVAKDELNDEKLNYEEVGDIKTLPYNDYDKFVRYNIKDVVLLRRLERKNDDVNMLFSIAEKTRTRLNKAMRKTVSLKNMAYKFYYDQGYAMGNNNNVKYYGEPSSGVPLEKYEGAVVADPELNDYAGIVLNGKPSKYIYENVIDFDLSSLYPSIIRAFNIDTSTQFGRLLIGDEPPTKEKDLGGLFIEHLESRNWVEIGKRWFNLPSTDELLTELEAREVA